MTQEDGYGEGVGDQLDEIQFDPSRRPLWEAVVDELNNIFDHPTSARANEILMLTSNGAVIHRVPLRVPGEPENYSILWGSDETGLPVIGYVGPWPPLK